MNGAAVGVAGEADAGAVVSLDTPPVPWRPAGHRVVPSRPPFRVRSPLNTATTKAHIAITVIRVKMGGAFLPHLG